MIVIPVNLAARMAVCVGLVALVPEMAPLAHAESPSPVHAAIPIEELKTIYLRCERAAIAGDLDTGAVMRCSIIYEELKRRAFDGDFKRMKAWSDTEIPAA